MGNYTNKRKVRRTLETIREIPGVEYRLLMPHTGEIFQSPDLARLFQSAASSFVNTAVVGQRFTFHLETAD